MNRLKEPSTWAGVAGIAQMLAQALPQYAWAFHLATAVAGSAAVALQERGGNPPAPPAAPAAS